MNVEGERIVDRKLVLCPTLQSEPVSDITIECPECHDFLLHCCGCYREQSTLPRWRQSKRPCHHNRIIFTDGACMNNGRPDATAGIGGAYGKAEGSQFSIPIEDSIDGFPLRSSQRAELLAARTGLEFMAEAARINAKEPSGASKGKPEVLIIATDSEHVAKGMTEWLPRWRNNNWVTSKGTPPVNLDLFLALDAEMKKQEANNMVVGFWRVPRENNQVADRLAKEASSSGDIASNLKRDRPSSPGAVGSSGKLARLTN